MALTLDHATVQARDRKAAARRLAEILGVPWAEETGIGPFSAVYASDELTLDFDQAEGAFPVSHFCFRVGDAEFDAIVERLRTLDIPYRSLPHGPVDRQVNQMFGGRLVYWSEPDGHVWEALTVSYARRKPAALESA
jgi:hypothetical protein